jgi:hypothetical protein
VLWYSHFDTPNSMTVMEVRTIGHCSSVVGGNCPHITEAPKGRIAIAIGKYYESLMVSSHLGVQLLRFMYSAEKSLSGKLEVSMNASMVLVKVHAYARTGRPASWLTAWGDS